MKNTYTKLLALSVFSATAFIACDSPAKKVEHATENLSEAKAELSQAQKDSVLDYETFKNESELRIAKNEEFIMAYKERMKKTKKELKEADQKMVDELEQKNINMRKKIEEFRTDGKDKWVDFKIEFNHDMDELGSAIKDLTVKNTH